MKITLLTGKTFDLENSFDFPLKINSSLKNRRMTIRIDSKARAAVLSVPKFYSKKRAYEFIKKHQNWIEEKIYSLPQIHKFAPEEQIDIFGKKITLKYDEKRSRIPLLKNDELYIGGEVAFFHRRVKDYIKKEAKKEFQQRSVLMAQKIGCQIKSISIKDTKSRWGSCSSLKNINYNWRIALAPEYVIDYLMAHEVAHLKHQDHSTNFWECVQYLYPEMEKSRLWLKQNGQTLYLYE